MLGKLLMPVEFVNANDGSDVNCGNCDYLLGSRCAKYDKYLGGPEYGENYCQKTECVDRNGDERINGESWCVYDDGVGNGGDRVGSRYFREICVDGKVRVEPCADFRNEICLESSIETDAGDFGTAACRVNRWQDCVDQDEEDDCLNTDRRDCFWMSGASFTGLSQESTPSATQGSADSQSFSGGNPTTFQGGVTGNAIAPITGFASKSKEKSSGVKLGGNACIPNSPPGLMFWQESDAQSIVLLVILFVL